LHITAELQHQGPTYPSVSDS